MEYVLKILPPMLEGSTVTLKLFFLTLLITLPLGVIMALARLSRFRLLQTFMELYIWLFRGSPLLLQLLFIYFGLIIAGHPIERFAAALIAFVLNYSAYLAEIYRGGIQSIDAGQYEAADVLGLNRLQTMIKIVLPQMIKRILPPMSNEVINLVKDTSLIYAIAISDVLRAAKTASVRDESFIPFLVALVFYLTMTAIIQQVFKWLEVKFSYYR